MVSHVGSATMPITPGYRRIVDDIIRQIECGELMPGDKLPSTRELMLKYGVGNTAVRNAILYLHATGHTEGHQGKGVFVRNRRNDPG